MLYFDHIPVEEKSKPWFSLLVPLLNARLKKKNYEEAPLVIALNRIKSFASWKVIKNLIEKILLNVKGGDKIFSRTREIENDPNPDNPITDMFAECRAAVYLLQKGFYDLNYFRQNNIDFHAKFDDKTFYIEVTYLHGPDLKIFGNSNPDPNIVKAEEEWDYSRKLTNFLKSKYSNKEPQFLKRSLDPSACLILIFTDLMETHEPWFDHAKIDGHHPIQHFVQTQKIATVLCGSGSVYEPNPDSLGGTFVKLNKFCWEEYKSSEP